MLEDARTAELEVTISVENAPVRSHVAQQRAKGVRTRYSVAFYVKSTVRLAAN
jgi:hypothetical protein